MDRSITYLGQTPLDDLHFLQPARDMVLGLGALAQAILGNDTTVVGLDVLPTQPNTLAVSVQPGAIYQLAPIDGTPFGSLAADLRNILKQGILLDPVNLTVAAPTTAGQSRNYLVQAAFSEEDGGAIVLPYFNSANPSQAYAGPGNSGAAQNTRRRGRALIQLRAGAAAATGSQVTPAPTSGFIGLAVITVANGQTSVSAANIQALATVPRPMFPLSRLRPGFGNFVSWSTPGTYSWVVPAGVWRIRARVWAGGGGGGGAAANQSNGGTGGGSGGFREGVFDVTPGDIITITVGAGGAAGGIGSNGGNGGSSSIGSLLSCTGGRGGQGGGAGLGTNGTGTGGAFGVNGYGGGYPWIVGTGTYSGGMGAAGWCGAPVGPAIAAPGPPGQGFGSGGSGGGCQSGVGSFAGGAGAPGFAMIEF